jgi:hypothetical protein
MAYQGKQSSGYRTMSQALSLTTLLVLFCLLVSPAQGQPDLKEYGKKKEVKLADYAFKSGNYYTAILLYDRIFEREPKNARIAFQIGESYRMVRDYKKSSDWYKRAIELDQKKMVQARVHYASMLKMQGQYDMAKEEFLLFKKKYRGPNSGPMRRMAGNEAVSCDYAKALLANPVRVQIRHLDGKINAVNADFAPMPFKDDLIFASLPADTIIVLENGTKEAPQVDLYHATRSGNWYKDIKLFTDGPFNKKGYHTANGSLSKDGKRFYFTRCKKNEVGVMICAIYRSILEDDGWSEPKAMSSPLNNKRYSSTQPSIWNSLDGRKEAIYFSSNRPGGKGGYDLWWQEIRDGEPYGNPRNLGRKINTYGDEVTPFYDRDHGVLYFSSNGHHTLGGLDVFSSEGGRTSFTTPENLGSPLNSKTDDFYYVLRDPSEGYLVSNRSGGVALKGETCCDDIYSVKWTNIFNLAVTGMTYDAGTDGDSKSKLQELVGAKVILIVTDGNGTQKTEVLTSLDSTGVYENGKLVGKKYFFNL